MSKTLIFLQENKIGSIEEMQERVDAATAHYHELGDSIKDSENRLAEIAVLKAHIINYAKTRPVYDLSLIHISHRHRRLRCRHHRPFAI